MAEIEIPNVLVERQAFSRARLAALHAELGLEEIDPGTACIYATGSVARGEASEGSDLDVFVLDAADESGGDVPLSHLASIVLRADLIRAARKVGFPEFSGDGMYLGTHSVTDLIGRTGKPDDDSSNAFTARLLLILESKVVLNDAAHEAAKLRVISSYWRDYEKNPDAFNPVFLVNDIIRFWKTVCLNYEADRTSGVPSGYDAIQWKNRNRLKDIKLKFSRLWTCHATTAHLLWLSREGRSVTPKDIARMLALTPFERLEVVGSSNTESVLVEKVLHRYAWFLDNVPSARGDAIAWIGDDDNMAEARGHGAVFGESVAVLLEALGQESPLYRFLLV
jgi:hypothetical protein